MNRLPKYETKKIWKFQIKEQEFKVPQYKIDCDFLKFYNYKMKFIFLLLLLTIAASQQCSTCIQYCGPDGKCLGCDTGFFLDNTGACGRFTPIEDCKTYDSQTGKCS